MLAFLVVAVLFTLIWEKNIVILQGQIKWLRSVYSTTEVNEHINTAYLLRHPLAQSITFHVILWHDAMSVLLTKKDIE